MKYLPLAACVMYDSFTTSQQVVIPCEKPHHPALLRQVMTQHRALIHGRLGSSSLTNSTVEDLSFPSDVFQNLNPSFWSLIFFSPTNILFLVSSFYNHTDPSNIL